MLNKKCETRFQKLISSTNFRKKYIGWFDLILGMGQVLASTTGRLESIYPRTKAREVHQLFFLCGMTNDLFRYFFVRFLCWGIEAEDDGTILLTNIPWTLLGRGAHRNLDLRELVWETVPFPASLTSFTTTLNKFGTIDKLLRRVFYRVNERQNWWFKI